VIREGCVPGISMRAVGDLVHAMGMEAMSKG
jgi:hypothetical protein